MAELVSKNIIKPSGGEQFYPDQDILIEFQDINLPSGQYFFDLFITLDFNGDNSVWDFIARLPIDTKTYTLKLNKDIYGENIRLATCGVSSAGLRSYKNVIAKSLTFKPRIIKDPIILNPVSNRIFSNLIDLIIENSYLGSIEKNNVRFYAYFSSNKLSILNSPIAERVDSSHSRITWNVSNLPNSDDYEILCYYADDFGNKSSDVSIKNINIINPGVCFIDTEPPQASIRVNNNSEYISDTNVSFKLYAYDNITEVNGFIIKEIKIQNGAPVEIRKSEPRNYASNNYYNVLDQDGRTYLGALVQDIAGNRTDYSLSYNSSLTFNINYFRLINFSIDNIDITSSDSNNIRAFFAISKNSNHYLIKKENMTTVVATFSKRCISLKVNNNEVLMSLLNDLNSIEIVKFNGTEIVSIYNNGSRNTKCNTIEFYKNNYYLGCENGILYKLEGSTLSQVYDFKNPIGLIEKTKNNIMNIYLEIGTTVFSYDGQNIVESSIII